MAPTFLSSLLKPRDEPMTSVAAPASGTSAGPPSSGPPAGPSSSRPPGRPSWGPPAGAPGSPPSGPPGVSSSGPPGPPARGPPGPPSSGPPGPPQSGPPDAKGQRCFETADETTICVVDKSQHHNTTDLYEQSGVSDRHNDYGHHATHDVAGNVPGRNVTEAALADGTAAGRKGDTQFGSHSFHDDGRFRDTHQVDPKDGRFSFEDHKEDFDRNGKDFHSHSSQPDGTRIDAENRELHQSESLGDVKDQNGATDALHKDLNANDWAIRYQKHHGGPDMSDAKDSKVTGDASTIAKHQKQEHKDADLHTTTHEESSGKGTFSFNVVGDHALGDFAEEARNWPETFPRDGSAVQVPSSSVEDRSKIEAAESIMRDAEQRCVGNQASRVCLSSENRHLQETSSSHEEHVIATRSDHDRDYFALPTFWPIIRRDDAQVDLQSPIAGDAVREANGTSHGNIQDHVSGAEIGELIGMTIVFTILGGIVGLSLGCLLQRCKRWRKQAKKQNKEEDGVELLEIHGKGLSS